MATARNSKKRPHEDEEYKETASGNKRQKGNTKIKKKKLPATLCKINHPDILLAFCEENSKQADRRASNYASRHESKNLFFLTRSKTNNSVIISAVNNPYGAPNYRPKHEMAIKFLLSNYVSKKNSVDKIWEDIPEATKPQEQDVLALFNKTWEVKLTPMNEKSYLTSFASVGTLTEAPLVLSPVFFNLRRIPHYPEIGWVFIMPSSKQAADARKNMMKPSRLGLRPSNLVLDENLIFISGEKKDEKVKFDKFFQAAIKFQATKNSKKVPTIDQFSQLIWDASESEEKLVVSRFKQKFNVELKPVEVAQSQLSQSESSSSLTSEVKNSTEPMQIETQSELPPSSSHMETGEPFSLFEFNPAVLQMEPKKPAKEEVSPQNWSRFFKTKESAALMFNGDQELVGDKGIEQVGPFM